MREARDADALVLAAETALAGTPTRLNGDDRYRVLLHADLAALGADPGPGSSNGVAAWLDDGPALSVEAAPRITCHTGIRALLRGPRGRLLDIGRRRRTIPPAMGRALHVRDGGCCRFPAASAAQA